MHPATTLARSPLDRLLHERGAEWTHCAGSTIANTLATAPNPAELALFDLTSMPRIGFKGRKTIEAMTARGIALQAKPNCVFPQTDGSLCLVFAPSEVLLLSTLTGNGTRFTELEESFSLENDERTYPLPRRDSHCWLAITGRHAPAILAKLCAIDMRFQKFPNHTIAQTSLARINAIVARADIGDTEVVHVLADMASALYLSTCLLDAAGEFGGEFAGLGRLEIRQARHDAIGGHS